MPVNPTKPYYISSHSACLIHRLSPCVLPTPPTMCLGLPTTRLAPLSRILPPYHVSRHPPTCLSPPPPVLAPHHASQPPTFTHSPPPTCLFPCMGMMVDSLFRSASEDFLNYETVLLAGAGIGMTPFMDGSTHCFMQWTSRTCWSVSTF